MKKIITGIVFLVFAVIVIAVTSKTPREEKREEPQEVVSQELAPQAFLDSLEWVDYENAQFGISFRYPKRTLEGRDLEVRQGDEGTIYINPTPQSVKPGPIMVISKYPNLENKELVDIIKDQYGEDLVSYATETINGTEWLHAQIRSSYFENVVTEDYITHFRKAEYLHVYHSKFDTNEVFKAILETLKV